MSETPNDAHLLRRLIATQFPAWAGLPVRPVLPGGWDNRTFRLGDAMSVRLPLDEGTWARARGWALWKALITLADHIDVDEVKAAPAMRIIDELLAEHTP